MLTVERMRELLTYNPDTGTFTWVRPSTNAVSSGDIAGCLANGYILIGVDGKSYQAHRLAHLWMTGSLPANVIDHINGIRDDNRWSNLRAVTQSENLRNACISRRNKSGRTGVMWKRDKQLWRAYICVNRVQTHLGYFTNYEDAVKSREDAEVTYGYYQSNRRAA